MTKILFAIDFDGVFNPLNKHYVWVGEGAPTELDHIYMDPKKWTIETTALNPETDYVPDSKQTFTFFGNNIEVQWSSELVENFNHLIEGGKIKFKWLSTWKRQAAYELAPAMGLNVEPEGSWFEATQYSHPNFFVNSNDYYQRGKFIALNEHYTDPETIKLPLVWVDDVATYRYDNYAYPSNTEIFERFGVKNLVIQTEPETGITRANFKAIEDFVDSF